MQRTARTVNGSNILHQLATVWTALGPRRRIVVAGATLAMFAAVLALARIAATPGMALLYSGLESGAAGEVIATLDQRGVAYEVRGGAVFVDAARRDELRMTLASEGLPQNSAQGYELLDGLSGFGTTSQMFDATYWRAKEGELARTIVSHPAVESARVHIARAGDSPFRRDLSPSASVSLVASSGRITAAHARALKYLVASAVAGMAPEDVSVIDGNGELVGDAERLPTGAADALADTLRQRVERLLAARVGAGNAVVEVSVDRVTRSESMRERVIDPESRVAISTETEEREDVSTGEAGTVTVASNLPEGDAGGDGSSSQASGTRERVNYEVSETERQIVEAPGAIKRITVAVLVNGTVEADQGGAPRFQPRPEDELAALGQLVASAVGFDEKRGDAITIKSMQFEPAVPAGTPAGDDMLARFGLSPMALVQLAVLASVALILGLFVVRPLLSGTRGPGQRRLAAPARPGTPPEGPPDEGAASPEVLTGEVEPDDGNASGPALLPGVPARPRGERAAIAAARGPHVDPAQRLRGLIGERRDETVEILRSWLEGEEESA